MFQISEFTAGKARHRVSALAVMCGVDLIVIVGGGEMPHIGAIGAATSPHLYDQNTGAAFVNPQLITFPNHKETEIVHKAVKRLSIKLKRNVMISAGMHITNASANDIQLLVENFDELINKIEIEIACVT
jgi:hypothetical protein